MNKVKKFKNKKFIALAIDDELKKQLEKEADDKKMTTSSYIRSILIKRK